jgi:acyl-CoA dehydrogenase
VWAVQEDAPEAPLAVAMAGATCPPAFLRCAVENVQLHGGIGFTWEHSAHLYVRRAESDLALFGDAEQHREGVLRILGI